MIIKKTYQLEFKDVQKKEDRAMFEGYASTFGNVDYDNDVIKRGAFSKSLQSKGEKFPILVDHRMSVMTQAGFNVGAKEDDNGLFVKGELNLETDAGRTAYALVKQAKENGVSMGLSIGFRISDYEMKDDVREIKEIDLFEYSIVVYGANPKAGVTSVKDLKDPKDIAIKKRDIEIILRDAGCSKKEAQRAVSAIFDSELQKFFKTLLNY